MFKRRYDYEGEIAKLNEELATINRLKGDAARDLAKWLIGKAAVYDRDILTLADNPIKNEREILAKRALSKATLGLASGIETTLRAEKGIITKLTKLMEIAEQAEPEEDNP